MVAVVCLLIRLLLFDGAIDEDEGYDDELSFSV